jgi:hypothetical protein
MMSALKRIAMVSLLFGLQVTAVCAAGPPALDVTITCGGAAQLAGRDKQACLEDERATRSTLAQTWSTYRADDRIRCVAIVQIGGVPSYVELLSCLQTKRDAKGFRESDSILVETDQSDQLTPAPDR